MDIEAINPANTNSSLENKIESLIEQSSTKINEVCVTNSEDVHFGNRNVINGDVIIKQYFKDIADLNGGNVHENKGYIKSEVEKLSQSIFSDGLKKNKKSTEESLVYHKIKTLPVLLAALFTCLVLIICTVLGIALRSEAGYTTTPEDIDIINEENTVFESAQLRFVRRDVWLAQPANGKLDLFKEVPKNVIITHTATDSCFSQADCSVKVRNMQMFHIEGRHWFDIGYNFLVGGDGQAYEGRGWNAIGAHTLGWNNGSIGIAFIGTFTQTQKPPVEAQVNALKKLLDVGVRLGKLSENYSLYSHNQFMTTESPGYHVVNIISKWSHYSKQAPVRGTT